MLGNCIENVRKNVPLVHNITNYVTVNDVANILLACGGSPIMSAEPEDVEDITSICGGLNINIGTLTKSSIEGMFRAGRKANELNHPILLDPVGAGASALRTNTAVQLMEQLKLTVIRGNISEIKTLALGSGTTKGVDADVADAVTEETLDQAVQFVKQFAAKSGSIVAITGAIDLVSDGEKCYVIRNGRPEMAGGTTSDKVMVVSGGPMMGAPMSWEAAMNASVTKTTSGILVLPEDGAIDRRRKTQLNHMLNRAKAACIQCTFCTQLCPRHMLGHPLQPHRIMRKMAMNMPHQDNNETTKDHWILPELLEDKDIRQAAICSECGVCEVYACPMGLQPRVVNSLIKGELAQAGIRYSREGDTWEADANRPYRKVPTKRIAARAGVGAYYHIDGHTYKEETASKVVLPLKMNIGVPAEPVISDGAHVEKGQLIAACPEGKLGANLHASISGTAHLTGNAITITEV